MAKNKEKIVVIGYGWVGQANALALRSMNYDTYYFDVAEPTLNYPQYKETHDSLVRLASPLEKDSTDTWYLVCVGDRVSNDGVQDISSIVKAVDSLKSAKGNIVLRSTVLPQFLKNLNFDFYVPEFLHEKKGVQECIRPFYFVVGARSDKRWPSFMQKWNRAANKSYTGTPEQAAYIKYLSNIWNASRVALVNEFGDILHQQGIEGQNAESVIDFVFDKKSYLRYGKSFGGHCLPKDLTAFSNNHDTTLFKAVLASNTAHQEVESVRKLNEWFSYWDYQATMSFRKLFSIFRKKIGLASLTQSIKRKAGPVAKLAMAKFKRVQ